MKKYPFYNEKCELQRIDRGTQTDSLLYPKKIYSGRYWDEFSLPLWLLPNRTLRVLILGVGAGAGCRPLWIDQRVREITGVDADNDVISKAQKYYDENFQTQAFVPFVSKCEDFLPNAATASYDLIWVDLYSEKGYAPCIFENDFNQELQRILVADGILAFNLYGCPAHLVNLPSNHIRHKAVEIVAENYKFQLPIEYRKNTTLLLSQASFNLQQVALRDGVKHSDRSLFFSQGLKILELLSQSKSTSHPNRANLSLENSIFTNIDKDNSQLWSDFITQSKSAGPFASGNFDLNDLRVLGEKFVTEPGPGMKLFHFWVENEQETAARFFPTFIAALNSTGSENYSWYPAAIVKNWHTIKNKFVDSAYSFHLAQALAMCKQEETNSMKLFPLLEKIVEIEAQQLLSTNSRFQEN